MKLNQDNINYIHKCFQDMQSNNDLLALINYVSRLYHVSENKKTIEGNKKTTPLKLNQLTYHAYHNKNPRYTAFTIKKKNGRNRDILAPSKTLKRIQKCLNIILECVFNPHIAAHGFIPQKSIVTNARVHTGQNYVYNIDLKDFFFSVDQARIWACLKNPPFNLKENRLELANLMTALCCELIEVERKNENGEWIKMVKSVLPQGAPTSPILTNIVAQRLDFQLAKLAKRFKLKYTRYADDLTFSSMHHVYSKNHEFIKELRSIIEEQNFYINEAKVRLQQNGCQRQEVTGLIVNEKVNIKRYYLKDVRRWLYLWERYGYDKTTTFFTSHYKVTRSNSDGQPNLINVLGGKLEYLKMVVGYHDNRFKQLDKRFNDLVDKMFPPSVFMDKKAEKIEISLLSSSPKVFEPKVNKVISLDLSKHKPRNITLFLSLFRSGELKWLTHWKDLAGDTFNLEELIANAHKEFKEETSRYRYTIPPNLYARINTFIGVGVADSKYWRFNHEDYYFHWQSKKVQEWCLKNPFQHPIAAFGKDINAFKASIQIRENLGELILDIAAQQFGTEFTKYKFHLKDLDKAEFFTDVEKLRSGFVYIFRSIIQRKSELREIKIEFKRVTTLKEDFRVIRVIHINSESSKPLNEIDILGGDTHEIMKNFYQIADWSIIAKHPDVDKYNKVNILFDIHNKKTEEKINDTIEGFTHELIFHS